MKHLIIIVTALFAVTSWASGGPEENKIVAQLKQEIVQDLKGNILANWAKHAPDPSGGFYGYLDYAWTPKEDASKGGILNARLVWTFSAAYRVLGDEQYLTLANRAQRYFLDHFIDKEYGGSYYTVTATGEPLDNNKQSYQNAFVIRLLPPANRWTITNNPTKMLLPSMACRSITAQQAIRKALTLLFPSIAK